MRPRSRGRRPGGLLALALAAALGAGPAAGGFPRHGGAAAPAGGTAYRTGAGRVDDPGVLNVHVVPHTHDDVGWLKTVDQYYYGTNSSLQQAAVRYIIESVVRALLEDEHRTFIYCESAFFWRWWSEQTDARKGQVRGLVRDGRLQFVNGGWSMHDEAGAHYVDMIDQTTRGHDFLKAELGAVPKIGWQIDPFGHSAVQAYLLSAEVGFEALFWGRQTYSELEARKQNRSLEFVWEASETLGASAQVFTGAFSSGNYGPPEGFEFDLGNGPGDAICDNPALLDYNVEAKVDEFVARAREIAAWHRGTDIMLPFGTDFTYGQALSWYTNIDKLIHYVNQDDREVNVFYSTPEAYVKAKKASVPEGFPTRTGDFFPYADNNHGWWTGYFTSRPTQKRFFRYGGGYLQSARQLDVVAGGATGFSTDPLEDAVGLVQHHDAITGTAKQHVANDYALRVNAGLVEAAQLVNAALRVAVAGLRRHAARLAERGGAGDLRRVTLGAMRDLLPRRRAPLLRGAGPSEPRLGEAGAAARRLSALELLGSAEGAEGEFVQCPLLNVSSCAITEELTANGTTVQAVVYNPTAWERDEYVRVPVASEAVAVFAGSGAPVVSQLIPVDPKDAQGDAKWTLTFKARLPPAGFAAFSVVSQQLPADALPAVRSEATSFGPGETATLRAGALSVTAAPDRRGLQLRFGNGTQVGVAMHYYEPVAPNDVQNDGAYIFRPGRKVPMPGTGKQTLYKGPVVEELWSDFGEWAAVKWRSYDSDPKMEQEWTVGPIPIADKVGKEVCLRFTSNLKSGRTFYTDSNGRDMMERTFNATVEQASEPVAANYYPITAAIAVRDRAAGTEFAVVTDRAQGAASLHPGEIEVMVHRRLLVDDARGVGEALNETACGCSACECAGLTARGVHTMVVGDGPDQAVPRRTQQLLAQDPVVVAFRPAAGVERALPEFSALAGALPPNVQLLTLKRLDDEHDGDAVLVRLAHLYQKGEHAALSGKATVDLKGVLDGAEIKAVEEVTLSANQAKDFARLRGFPQRGRPLRSAADTAVELGAMEIRTFRVHLA